MSEDELSTVVHSTVKLFTAVKNKQKKHRFHLSRRKAIRHETTLCLAGSYGVTINASRFFPII